MMAFMTIKGNIIWSHFLKALPSADNFHSILRAITVYFWDEVFSLRIWGHFIQQCSTDLILIVMPYKKCLNFWMRLYIMDHSGGHKTIHSEGKKYLAFFQCHLYIYESCEKIRHLLADERTIHGTWYTVVWNALKS